MSRRDLAAEILCKAKGCPSHFEHGLGPEWDHPKGIRGHFHHHLRIDVRDRDQAVNDYCPACGQTDRIVELRRMSAAHRFAFGDLGFGVELNAACTQRPGRAKGFTPKALALQAQVRGILETYLRGHFPDTEDGRLNAEIVGAEERRQKHPQSRERILQFYDLTGGYWSGHKAYVLTEAGRHQTTVAFAQEY